MTILPLYAAAYAVILCALAAFASTDGEDGIGGRSMMAALLGLAVSLFCRTRRWRQNAMFGVLAGLVVVGIFWVSVAGGTPLTQMLLYLANGRSTGPGLMLAWFLVLYSFAMIADEVIVFSVVPSMALLGLMASENLNPEIVIYFLGLVLSAVFLLVYENMLSRGLVGNEEGDAGAVPMSMRLGGVRTALLLATVVLALALVAGFGVSVPLQLLGREISDRSPQFNVPPSPAFLQEATQRYVNQLELSGTPPHLSDHIVMRIQASTESGSTPILYWRGKVFDTYTGSSWTANPSAGPMPKVDSTFNNKIPLSTGETGESGARQIVTQDVQFFDAPLSGMLVAAGEPLKLTVKPSRRRRRWMMDSEAQGWPQRPTSAIVIEDRYRCLSVMDNRPGMSYEVRSAVAGPSPQQLEAAGTNYPFAVKLYNLRLDDSDADTVNQRRQIALRVTANAKTPYDKVEALTEYLQSNFSYTLSPPRTPTSVDAVTYFLTQTKEGYCEIFASSLAVLCRDIGIPARLATGFAPGEWDYHTQKFTIREKDLHAWTEVYFPGYGWIPFDATATREAQSSMMDSLKEFVLAIRQQLAARSTGPMIVMTVMGGLLLLLAKWYGFDRLRASTALAAWLARVQTRRPSAERWDMLYAHAISPLGRTAGPRRASETPAEFGDRARSVVAEPVAAALDRINALYTSRAFRQEGPTASDIAELLTLHRELKAAVKGRYPEAEAAAA